MTKEVIREAIVSQPFVPFTVKMADGSSYEVPARDFVSISPSPNGRTLIIYGQENEIRWLDIMLVTEIKKKELV